MQTETEEYDNGNGNSGKKTRTSILSNAFNAMETTMCYLHNCCHLYCSATCAVVNNIKHTRPLCEVPNFFSLVFTKFRFSEQILVKVSNTKFHKNLSSGSQADTCGQVGAQLINVDQ